VCKVLVVFLMRIVSVPEIVLIPIFVVMLF